LRPQTKKFQVCTGN